MGQHKRVLEIIYQTLIIQPNTIEFAAPSRARETTDLSVATASDKDFEDDDIPF